MTLILLNSQPMLTTVKSYMREAYDQRIGSKPGIIEGILHNKQFGISRQQGPAFQSYLPHCL